MPRSTPPSHHQTGPTPLGSDPGQNIPPELAGLAEVGPADLPQPSELMSTTVNPEDPAPSRRRPQREVVVTYRIRVDLDGAEPPIWRLLELASDLHLDQVHHILQTAMGWTESHLHEFASGESPTHQLVERYLPAASIDDGLDGIDETQVRLDELLVDPGDRLFYAYDFGDDWAHTLRLEVVSERDPEAPPAICISGARACPPEDCGGIWGYQDLLTAAAHPVPANQELREWAGPDFDPDRFNVDDVNSALLRAGDRLRLRSGLSSMVDPASPLGDVLSRMAPTPDGVVEAVTAALRPIAEPDPATMAAMLDSYIRLLDLVGDDGITLTGADYLPPKYVEAVADFLRVSDFWISKSNREVNNYPILEFRECVRRLGLIRKANHHLTLTKTGSRARTDVGKLWIHVTKALPLGLTTRGAEVAASKDAGLLRLVGIAAGLTGPEQQALIFEGMAALGWRTTTSDSLSAHDVRHLLTFTDAVLEHVYVIPRDRMRGVSAPYSAPPAAAQALAKAALDH
jgi:hypothetical protein